MEQRYLELWQAKRISLARNLVLNYMLLENKIHSVKRDHSAENSFHQMMRKRE